MFATTSVTAILVLMLTSPSLQVPAAVRNAPVPADLVLLNGKIWTGDPSQLEVEALAVKGGRILTIGKNPEIKALVGEKTRVIDLNGRRAVPGFHDSHIHLLGGGRQLSQVSLKDAKDEAEFGRRLREFHQKLPRDRWLLGDDWDHDRTFAGQLPTAELIDKYVPDRPVFLRRYDGHMGVVNSMVLELAAITSTTKDPSGGVIYRKPNSKEPTGLLRDNAMNLVSPLVPAAADAEVVEAIRAALGEARRFGVTSVQDMDGGTTVTRQQLLRHYQRLAQSGDLTLRVELYWPLAEWQSLARLGIRRGFGDDWVKIGALKGFVDGSLGSSTAKMFEPYLNEPSSRGIYVTPLERLREYIGAADQAGLAVAVHAIGDQANADILDIFADVAKKNANVEHRFRIEHAQHLRPKEYDRFREFGVIPSLQPYHLIDDGRWAEGRIGTTRCASSYANRSLLDAGAKLAFGSDWPVAPLNPLVGIDAAVNRRTLDGKDPQGWFPDQKISVAEAVSAYTLGSAFAAFQEKQKGSLEVGKLADVAVLAGDIFSPSERDRIATTEVTMTIVGGKVVHDKR